MNNIKFIKSNELIGRIINICGKPWNVYPDFLVLARHKASNKEFVLHVSEEFKEKIFESVGKNSDLIDYADYRFDNDSDQIIPRVICVNTIPYKSSFELDKVDKYFEIDEYNKIIMYNNKMPLPFKFSTFEDLLNS